LNYLFRNVNNDWGNTFFLVSLEILVHAGMPDLLDCSTMGDCAAGEEDDEE